MNDLLRSLDPVAIEVADRAIIGHITESPLYRDAKTIFTYIGVKNEVPTMDLALKALDEGKTVCCPLTLGGGIMEARRIFSAADLRPGRRKLMEPVPALPLIKPEDIDLVIVPCLSCDPYGNRIGYGGGYYDRYLAKLKDRAITIAPCRQALMSRRLPNRPTDISVACIATEAGIFPSVSGSDGI